MEGEERPKAGQALRQARFDRRNKVGYRRPTPSPNTDHSTAQDNAVTEKDAEALSGVNPNTATAGNASKKASAKVSELDGENEKPKAGHHGNQVDSSTRKPKKKSFWNYRRHYPRKSKDTAAVDHKKTGEANAGGVKNETSAIANHPDQAKSVSTPESRASNDQRLELPNGHTNIQEVKDNKPAGAKPDTSNKENSTSPSVTVSSKVKNGDAKVKQVTPVTEVKATPEHVEAVEPEAGSEQLENGVAI